MPYLVEREAALQALDYGLREVGNGGGRIALIAGEAGIGKTSLLRAFAQAHPSTPNSSGLFADWNPAVKCS